MTTYKDRLNQANPNHVADLLRELGLGHLIESIPTHLRKQEAVAGAASNHNQTTVHVLVLPATAKASTILRATARAGGVTGEFTPQVYGTTPATTQVAVTPCGDIAFVAADAPTDVDVVYVAEKGEPVELTLEVAAGVATIPSSYADRGVILLMEAEGLEGTVTGDKKILVPGTAGATGTAKLNAAKTQVLFNSGTDALTSCRVKFLVAPEIDSAAKLQDDVGY